MGGLTEALGAIGSRLNGARRFAGDVLTGNATEEQLTNAVKGAILNAPSLYMLPVKAAEKITGVPVEEGFRQGVVSEVGDPRSGKYEIRIPPMPY